MPVLYWGFLIVLLLTGCDSPPTRSEQPVALIKTAAWQLVLNNQDAPVETPLQLALTFDSANTKTPVDIQAEIVGLSMYMGKVPLRFTALAHPANNIQVFTTEFLLGACSDPKMQWQLNIRILYSDDTIEMNSSKFYSSWH